MEISKNDNRIFPDFSPRAAAVIVFALAALIGALSGVFLEVPTFSAITVFILSAIIFFFARDILPICGILLPCLLEITATGSLTLPALYIGFTFCVGVTAYLAIGKRGFVPIIAGALGYAAAAVIRDPITAIIVLIPIALGLLAALMLPRFALSETLSSMTILLLSAGIIAFLSLGGDISATADALRNYILELYKSMNETVFIIEESAAEMLAAYLVNILPGIIFAAVSVICYVSCALTVSLLRSSGLGEEIPENMHRLSLSPVSGILFILCFFLSAAFSIEGGEYEIAAAAADNILIALILPFALSGGMSFRNFLMNRIFAASLRRRAVSLAAIAILFFFSPSIALIAFTLFGVSGSLKPIFTALTTKIKSSGQKQ